MSTAEMTCEWCDSETPQKQTPLTEEWLCDECYAKIKWCDICSERIATHEGSELINSEMGFKQYGAIQLCDHCDSERDAREERDERHIQEWKDGERPINGRYRGQS